MSQTRLSFSQKNPFVIRTTKPRKMASLSQLKLSAEDRARDFGSQYQTIDVRIGNQRMILDITQGIWILDEAGQSGINSQDVPTLETRKQELEEENKILRIKLDILKEMHAEILAEEDLQGELNKQQ